VTAAQMLPSRGSWTAFLDAGDQIPPIPVTRS